MILECNIHPFNRCSPKTFTVKKKKKKSILFLKKIYPKFKIFKKREKFVCLPESNEWMIIFLLQVYMAIIIVDDHINIHPSFFYRCLSFFLLLLLKTISPFYHHPHIFLRSRFRLSIFEWMIEKERERRKYFINWYLVRVFLLCFKPHFF